MAEPNDHQPDGAPRHIHIEKDRKVNWIAWLLLALGILALLFALSRCHRDNDTTPVVPAATATPGNVVATTPNADESTALASTSALGGFLAGSEAAPRRFQFDKLNFDTGKSDLRPQDTAGIDEVATVLKKYGNAHVSIAGYADSRGNAAANMALGKARADAIKAALVNKGIDASRIQTTSGGENDPVDSNATANGQAENRRTELAVTSR